MKPSFKAKLLTWFGIAAVHFGLSNLILPITMSLAAQGAGTANGQGLRVTLLVRMTKMLHFPLVTLALYPREWFPGNWVYVPMALNSVIWAFGIYGMIVLFRKSL